MFILKLINLYPNRKVEILEREEELNLIDDMVSMLIYACDKLENLHTYRFMVSGFGQHDWPTDLSVDLATILEQLPLVNQNIRISHGECSLDFYEQGIERKIQFTWPGGAEGKIQLYCSSRTDWKPDPESVEMYVDELRIMLAELQNDFCTACKECMPKLVETEYFKAYCSNRF